MNTHRLLFRLLLPVCLLAVIALPSSASILAEYETLSGPDLLKPTGGFTDANLTATDITLNNVTAPYRSTFANLTQTGSNFLAVSPTITQSTVNLSTTLTNATYLSFTFTPASGFSLSMDSLTFGAFAGGSSTRSFYVFSSLSGFTTADPLLSVTYSASGTVINNYSITLSGMPAYQNVTGPVEFRIYDQAGGTSSSIEIGNNIILNGTVSAIPEPSTYAALVGGFSLTIVALRRRRPARA